MHSEKKKVLITGSSGYIGSHLTHALLPKYEVHGLDIVEPKIQPHKFFLRDITQSLRDIDTKYDAVIHLAAKVSVTESESNPNLYIQTNGYGTINVFGTLEYDTFILASTGLAEYGDCIGNPYAVTKRAAEMVVETSPSHTIFRFYNVIGQTVVPPTNPDGLMANLIESLETKEFTIYGNVYNTRDHTCIRDYLHVDEVCAAIEKAIETPSNKIECLGHGIGYTVKEIVDIFQEVNNVKLDVKYGPKRSGDLPITMLKNVSPYMEKMYTIQDLLKVKK